ncbi:MAG: phospholipid carrier-dependent glycosyltransferase [Anaerolineales bacterium]|nr:phospholipid carrier-dependent glycosyltransferase [Anaerolineales bacterium]MCB9126560.1 phospholipid carrier-dependent glycosyltransferase [Ardenticatenales bacterium]MCB9172514.1 phospholipid carrier-dependent glycosyltransferase [Ardenticatenales bacterium]
MNGAAGSRRLAAGIGLIVFALYLFSYVGAFKVNDERAMFAGMDSFVKRGEFTTNPIFWDYTNVGMLTRAGEMVPNYEPGQMIFAIPFYLWGRLFDAAVQGAMLFPLAVSAAAAALLFLTAQRLAFDRRASLLAALVFAFGTMAWPYSKTFYRDSFATLAYILSFWALLHSSGQGRASWRYALLFGIALGLAISVKQVAWALVGLLLLLFVYYLWRQRSLTTGWDRLLSLTLVLLALGVAVLLIQGYEQSTLSGVELFRRNLVDFSTNPQLSSSEWWRVLRGASALTISPFRGIFWYSPVLLLAFFGTRTLWRRWPAESVVLWLIVLVHLAGYSRSLFWAGGAAWGSRYMLVTAPFLVLLATPIFERVSNREGPRWQRAIVLALIALSVSIQCLGVALDFRRYELETLMALAPTYGGIGEAIDATYLNPRYSPVFGHLSLLLEGYRPLDVAWMPLRAEGSWAILPQALLLLIANLIVAGGGFWLLWRRAARGRWLLPLMAISAILTSTLYLQQIRSGDGRFDPYQVGPLLEPLLAELADVDCQRATFAQPARCDAALVVPDPLLTDYLLTHLDSPLPWYAFSLPPADEDVAALTQLAERYPTLYLLSDRSRAADMAEAGRATLEEQLMGEAYLLVEQTVEGWSRLLRFSAAGGAVEQHAGQSLGPMALDGALLRLQRDDTTPPRAGPVDATPLEALDDGAVQARAGQTLQIGMVWRADATISANYTVFVQLLDEGGKVVAQHDGWPRNGQFATSSLAAGDQIRDSVALPLDLPAGRYRLIAGLYQADAEGAPRLAGPAGDTILLAEVTVTEPAR